MLGMDPAAPLYRDRVANATMNKMHNKSFLPYLYRPSSIVQHCPISRSWGDFITSRKLVKAMLKMDRLLYPRVRNGHDAFDFHAKVYKFWIRVVLGIKASLSREVLLVDVESARDLFQIEKFAVVEPDFPIPCQYAEPDFKRYAEVRIYYTFDLIEK